MGAGLGAATGALLSALHPASPIGPLSGVFIFAVGIYLAAVRLAVGEESIVLGQGPFAWPSRTIATASVVDARAENLTWLQTFGFGVPRHWATMRMTVRSGPTLVLSLVTGECIRVSTRDAGLAVGIIRSAMCPGGGEYS